MIILILLLGVIAILLIRSEVEGREGRESLAAINADCESSEALMDWRLRNPGVYIGLSPEGRRLLTRRLEAYDRFLRSHKFCDVSFKEHREWLVSLFYDLPPKHPDFRDHPKQGVQTNAFLFTLDRYFSVIYHSTIWLNILMNLMGCLDP
jgi:hypothetical protein